jgi:hypothetical protein
VARRRGELIGVRWELGDELPGGGDLRRYRLRDRETGEAMELWEPRASVALRPGAARALAAASQASPTSEAALSRIPVPTEQGTVIITQPTQGSLASRELRLSPEQAHELARWLAPAVLDPRSNLAGRLRPDDVQLDSDGVPRILSLGLPAAEAVLEVPHHTAPEVLRGAEPTASAGLYGLGVMLYRSLTGAWPVPAKNLQDLLARQPTPIRPSTLDPRLPPAVDVLVEGLLSLDPQQRIETVRELGAWSGPPPVLDLAPLARPKRPKLPVPTTTTVPTTSDPGERPGRHLVVAQVHDLPPSARYLVAALAGLDEARLMRASTRKQAVVVAGLARVEAAQALAQRLAGHGIQAQVRGSTGTGRGALGLAAATAIVTAGISLIFSPLASLAIAGAGFALAMLAWSRPPRSLQRGPGPQRAARPEVAGLQQRVDRLAVRLAGLELPEPVARDLRDDLFQVHQRVDELARSRAEITRSLHSIDDAEAGEPLRRSVAAIDAEFDEIADVLDELEAAVTARGGAAETAPDTLDRLNRRIQALRSARSELEPSTHELRERRRRAASKQLGER